jgi:hypothetical protein
VSFATLLEDLEVSRATLKRDLAYLRSRLGAPIEYDRDTKGYRFGKDTQAGGRHELPRLWFSEGELYSLLTARQLLPPGQRPHARPPPAAAAGPHPPPAGARRGPGGGRHAVVAHPHRHRLAAAGAQPSVCVEPLVLATISASLTFPPVVGKM